jgi:hypothetical protein
MAQRKPVIEGWVCQLHDNRLEIFLKVERMEGTQDRKIRASGSRPEMEELIAWFEEKSGLKVEVPWRTTQKPIPGQMTLVAGEHAEGEQPSDELSSHDATVG